MDVVVSCNRTHQTLRGRQPWSEGIAILDCSSKEETAVPYPIPLMISTVTLFAPVIAAAGPAFLVWLFGGGFGLAIVVFIVLKVLGK
ncbi:MAG: hypothetical protein JWL90_3617 [Chthoniobacteraceae bacterium]|nr:hypothetical protein [Chthoniobacteraceae bacterium]